MDSLITHHFATPTNLPAPSPTSAIEYWVGATHIYARAARPGLSVLMPISNHKQPIKGLVDLDPYVHLTPLVPKSLLWQMWAQANVHLPNEVLFHLVLEAGTWTLVTPDQTQSQGHCEPTQTDAASSSATALIELHSHGHLPAFFSNTDNQDERGGFRIYGVLGQVNNPHLELVLRVGLFGHGWIIPAHHVFDINPSNAKFADLAHTLKVAHHAI